MIHSYYWTFGHTKPHYPGNEIILAPFRQKYKSLSAMGLLGNLE